MTLKNLPPTLADSFESLLVLQLALVLIPCQMRANAKLILKGSSLSSQTINAVSQSYTREANA